MRDFGLSLRGRVKNFSLPENKSLIPLFEAVVNSLQAIAERQKTCDFLGEISILIDREDTLSEDIIGKIEDITIVDNGIGFDSDNFNSFMESDSAYKENIGGKGVGRFSWLKAFEKVEVDSTYNENGTFYRRAFEFSLKSNKVDDGFCESTSTEYRTKVKLCSFNDKYKKNAPVGLDTIAVKLIQHCFVYLLDKDCPKIVLSDNKGEYISVNQVFNEKIILEEGKVDFYIAEAKFTLTKFRVENEIVNGHKVYLCANNRLVESKDLSKSIVNLDRILQDENPFWVLGVITSDYLDNNVDMNRLSFTIPENVEDGFVPVVTMSKIMEQAVRIIEQSLSDFLKPVAEQKRRRIVTYVSSQAPQYRHLLKYMSDKLEYIKPSVTDEKLDEILYKLDRDFVLQNKKEGQQLVEELKNDVTHLDEYKKRFEEHVARISDENKSILAQYVAHRKSIIDLFEVGMCRQEDGKFVREAYMHNLIYPMGGTSDDIRYEQHNLWLVDERLAYFFFASSDIPFNNDRSEDRPDLMLFDKSIALLETQNDGTAYDTIVIFELKRPMRDDLATNNPVEQIIRYMTKIKTNTVTDKKGRIIHTDSHTKFYLYVVCDALDKYRNELADFNNFNETIDKLGMFRMRDNVYIEVLTYDKIINDAKKRNKILFDKLGI